MKYFDFDLNLAQRSKSKKVRDAQAGRRIQINDGYDIKWIFRRMKVKIGKGSMFGEEQRLIIR